MSPRKFTVKLSEAEIRHLLHLLDINDEDRTYYGPKQEYKKRAGRLASKLREQWTLART